MPPRALLVLPLAFAVLQSTADEPAPPREPKQALAWFNDLVGEWRGVGQVKRGSTRGAWRETGAFRWDFAEKTPAVLYEVEDGKHLASLRIAYDVEDGLYRAIAIGPDEEKQEYAGRIEKNVLTLETSPDDDGRVQRIVLTQLNDKRTLVRYERGQAGRTFAARLGEVGYTREGTRLANVGEVGPVCIVTGGRGTILVKHEGKSYYVCCTGCKQAFEDDPAGVIAEYEAKRAEPSN